MNMANWIRDSEPLESIRVSFRADPYRDQAVHQALSKLPFRAGGAFVRFATAQAIAAGLVNVDDFLRGLAPQRAPRAVRPSTQVAPPMPADAQRVPQPPGAQREVPEAKRPTTDAELDALRATTRF